MDIMFIQETFNEHFKNLKHCKVRTLVLNSGCTLEISGKLLKNKQTKKNQKCNQLNLEFRRRQWHPTPILLPGKSMDRGAW